jgi:hypothetical protein
MEDLEEISHLIGDYVTLKVKGYAFDNNCMAVLVEPPAILKPFIKNKSPHITIAVDGVPPRYSNDLLKKGPVYPVKGSFLVGARVGWRSSKGTDHFEIDQ